MNNLDNIYNLRNDFLIIGLTGRTGSGCSTTAEILTQEKFEDCEFPQPIYSTYNHNEERRYRIVYDFLKENWKRFHVIRASDIITAILLENDFNELVLFLNDNYSSNYSKIENELKCIKEEYEKFYRLRCELINLSEGNNDEKDKKKNASYNFHLNSGLPVFTQKLKNIFNKLGAGNEMTPYQRFGNNIRSSGKALDSTFDPKNSYKIASIINKLIKVIREKEANHSYIVIDSIRNSLEALYLKERYSAFYLMAINTEDTFRNERLAGKMNLEQIKELDEAEYEDKRGKKRFIEQDIKSCIQISDIYIYNPNDKDGDTKEIIKKQLVKYLALIKHPGIITPSPEERCMQIAYTAKYNSGCISRQVGAVVTDQFYSIKAVGWNNTAEGQTPCLLRNIKDLLNGGDKASFSSYEKSNEFKSYMKPTYRNLMESPSLKGRNISFCFKDAYNCKTGEKNQVHTRSLHAEENAFLQVSKYGGQSVHRGYLFTTASPCELCSKKAYQLGISQVFYIDPYPGIAKEHILNIGEVENRPQLKLFDGAIGRAYHQLYEPFMPYKDELKILLEYKYQDSSELTELKTNNEDLKTENAKLKEEILRLKKKASESHKDLKC